jgi:hypothetical protein
MIVTALGRKTVALLAVAAPGGDPSAPFVIGKEGGGDENDGKDAEEYLHGVFRIA